MLPVLSINDYTYICSGNGWAFGGVCTLFARSAAPLLRHRADVSATRCMQRTPPERISSCSMLQWGQGVSFSVKLKMPVSSELDQFAHVCPTAISSFLLSDSVRIGNVCRLSPMRVRLLVTWLRRQRLYRMRIIVALIILSYT